MKWLKFSRISLFVLIWVLSLFSFEAFNFSSTELALEDVFGDMALGPVRLAMFLAIAFCALDFAGLARIITPEVDNEPREIWWLFAAWLLGTVINAYFTWYAATIAMMRTESMLNIEVMPIIIAVAVWLSRLALIGFVGVAGDRLLAPTRKRKPTAPRRRKTARTNQTRARRVSNLPPPQRPQPQRQAIPDMAEVFDAFGPEAQQGS